MKTKNNKNKLSIINLIILPVLFLIMLLSFGFVKAEASKGSLLSFNFSSLWGSVLGEEDEEDSEDRDDEESEDSDEREDDTDLDEEDRDDEDVDDSDDEEDVELDEKPVLINTVTNPDGTVTKTYQITDDGKVVTKTVTYDASGRVVSDDEENEDGTEHDETIELISTKDNGDGTITKIFKITDDDGDVEMKAITYDKDEKVIKIVELNPDGTVKEEKDIDEDDRDEDGHEIEFEYKSNDNTNPELNNLIEAELEQEIETNSELGTTINKVEINVKTVNGEYEYEGATFKGGKLFGIFDVSIPMGIEIDPATGQILSVNQTFWSKLLDFFSL